MAHTEVQAVWSYMGYLGSKRRTTRAGEEDEGPTSERRKKMKAYYATDIMYEYGYLVFAESRGEAKSKAFGKEGLCYGDFTDIRVRRIPEADQYWKEFGDRDLWETRRGQEVLRSLGWYGTEEPIYCEECGLGEFDLIPESRISVDGLCGECGGR